MLSSFGMELSRIVVELSTIVEELSTIVVELSKLINQNKMKSINFFFIAKSLESQFSYKLVIMLNRSCI